MHPLADIAAVAHVTRHWIEGIGRLIDASLDREPRVEVSHVVHAGNGGRYLLFDLVRAEVAVLVEKLREVWTHYVPGRQAAKERGRCDCAAILRSLEIRSV